MYAIYLAFIKALGKNMLIKIAFGISSI